MHVVVRLMEEGGVRWLVVGWLAGWLDVGAGGAGRRGWRLVGLVPAVRG